jgi:leucine dehydrogenase
MSSSMADWDGEEIITRRDRATGAWTIIAIHSTVRGPGMGGTRMRHYERPEDAQIDAMRLAQGMTLKQAVADMPFGGGKAVIAVPADLAPHDRTRLLLDYGTLVESLAGRFVTGPDMGTGEADMDLLGTVTSHVFCRSIAAGGSGTASPWTAAGVFSGIKASLEHATGSSNVAGRRVVVQGVGAVGGKLAHLLHDAGAELLLADEDSDRALTVSAELTGSTVIAPTAVISTEADVYSPNAGGGTVNRDSIPRLRCRVIAGAANNQLGQPSDADLLRERGILYAPDYVINSGGIIRGIGAETLHWPEAEIDRKVDAIGDSLLQIYRDADATGSTTDEAAARIANERLLTAA